MSEENAPQKERYLREVEQKLLRTAAFETAVQWMREECQ